MDIQKCIECSRRTDNIRFCSKSCQCTYSNKYGWGNWDTTPPLRKCLECKKETSNKKFCSRSCRTTYINLRRNPERPRKVVCPGCNKKKDINAKLCHRCKRLETLDNNMNRSLEDVMGSNKNKWAQLRSIAKDVMDLLSDKPRECEICSFDLVINICHIKGVGNFPMSALVREVNSLENLLYLCPNHHAMLDRGLVKSMGV